jgi:hypothetical protein
MPKLKLLGEEGGERLALFYCPGCKQVHPVPDRAFAEPRGRGLAGVDLQRRSRATDL